jgi:glutaminyl-peptide cyclotransferase
MRLLRLLALPVLVLALAAPVAAQSPATSALPTEAPSSPAPIARLGYEVVARRPHDDTAWTQGLLFDADGRLFESTGIIGRSQVRELDPMTGAVLRSAETPGGAYGEGLALVGDRFLVQITWTEGRATAFDKETFGVLDTFDYTGQGEGWGLCFDGTRLVMSNGTPALTFRDPATFAVEGTVEVTANGEPVFAINELANLWQTDLIVRIDPTTGAVTGVLDLAGILQPHPARTTQGAYPNGIAKVPGSDTWLLTGKLWPQMIEVRITEP